ncbi:hypothetical protein GCM10027519_42170 [Kineococcus endophyticus]
MLLAPSHGCDYDVGQRRRLGGEHVECVMDLAVGGTKRDVVISGEVGHRSALAHEPQQDDHLREASQSSLASQVPTARRWAGSRRAIA